MNLRTIILLLLLPVSTQAQYYMRLIDGAGITYPTWNPATKANAITFSNGNLTFTGTNGIQTGYSTATVGKSSGKWYWEITINSIVGTIGSSRNVAGVSNTVPALNNSTSEIGAITGTAGMRGNAFNTAVWYNFGSFQNLGSWTTDWAVGSVLSYALDMDGLTLRIYLDGNYINTSIPLPSGTFYPACGSDGQGLQGTANFGQNSWSSTTSTLRSTLSGLGYTIGIY